MIIQHNMPAMNNLLIGKSLQKNKAKTMERLASGYRINRAADDRSKIANEISQIYDEMERIFETTEFNTMKIFRHDGDNYYGPEPEYLYHEKVTELGPDELSSWGAAMFPTKYFDTAKEATPATATLTLPEQILPLLQQ